MLVSLQVKNFAIIDQVEVDFAAGMTVLTGETGAGKSILVDALGLVLGERSRSGVVRESADRAEFTAEFDLAALPQVEKWLEEQALDSDGECLLRRIVNADGRSRAFVNGNAVPLAILKKLGEMLLDIHGQHFHQSLGKAIIQRDLLDHFADALELRASTAVAFDTWLSLAEELDALQLAERDRASRLDLLTFQSNELDSLDLQSGEYEQLMTDRSRLLNSGKLAEGVMRITEIIYDADAGSAQSLIGEAQNTLDALAVLDASLAPVAELLREADIQLSEAADSLRRYGDKLDADPAERDRVEERLDVIQTLSRKHNVSADGLLEMREQLHAQLHDLLNAEQRGLELEQRVADASDEFGQAAKALSARRHNQANVLSQSVTNAMADLGMGGGTFEIAIRDRGDDGPKAHGIDDIEFLISANPGQPPMPLAKIASGGELSRMSLAIQVIASDGSKIPTMIFDEVDSGVGGGIAEMVGQRLRDVASSRQVLCVTHLPQVASLANHHLRIAKITDGKSTRTSVSALNDDERIDELARMLGGVEITKRTRDHAAEMLQTGSDYSNDSAAASRRA